MRISIPQDIPQGREPESARTAPLPPSPMDLHREQLRKRATENRGPQSSSIERKHRASLAHSLEPESRKIAHDIPRDRRPRRNTLPHSMIGIALREEEKKILTEVGRFRVIATRDLAATLYSNRTKRMERDLAFLRQQGFIKIDTVNARRDGQDCRVERIEVVTLSKDGKSVAQRVSQFSPNQKFYADMVKPREVEHDTQIYRAFLKQAQSIEQRGSTNLRVKLDFELKSQIQKAIYLARKTDPTRDMQEIKAQVAKEFELPFVDGGIQVPDARIEYDLPCKEDQDQDLGSRSGHEDIEVLTAAYRPGHLHHKAQAGFHLYASSSDRATLTAKIENEHPLMGRILEL